MNVRTPLGVLSATLALGLVPLTQTSSITSEPRFGPMLALPSASSSVACPTTTSCSATTTSADTVAVATESNGVWGASQPVFTAPAGRELVVDGFLCPSLGNCSLVGVTSMSGSDGTFAVTETHGTWGTPQSIAPPSVVSGSYTVLHWALSCPSAGTCTAVGGFYYDGQTKFATAAATSAAGVWASAAQIPGAGDIFPQVDPGSISCTSSKDCVVLEGASNPVPLGNATELFQTEVAGVWQSPASPPNSGSWLRISCWSPGDCIAVGVDSFGQPLYASVSNGNWGQPHVIRSPTLLGAPREESFDGLACTGPADCLAVGFGFIGSGRIAPVAVAFRHSIPSSVALDRLGPSSSLGFDDLVCPSASTCFSETFGGRAHQPGWLAAIDTTQHFSRPGPPVHPDAHVRAYGYILLTWEPPVVDGGAPVTGFTVRVLGTSKSCRTVRTRCLIDGLVAGQRYRGIVFDTTAKGRSLAASTKWFVST